MGLEHTFIPSVQSVHEVILELISLHELTELMELMLVPDPHTHLIIVPVSHLLFSCQGGNI